MGYTNYLTVKSITKEQFDLLCDVSAEAFYMWQKRFVGATLTLAPNADDKSNILAILVHSSLERKTEREIVSDISKEWKKNMLKWNAALQFCKANGLEFKVLTEKTIERL